MKKLGIMLTSMIVLTSSCNKQYEYRCVGYFKDSIDGDVYEKEEEPIYIYAKNDTVAFLNAYNLFIGSYKNYAKNKDTALYKPVYFTLKNNRGKVYESFITPLVEIKYWNFLDNKEIFEELNRIFEEKSPNFVVNKKNAEQTENSESQTQSHSKTPISYNNKNHAYIASQDYVKAYVKYPNTVEFLNTGVVHETDGYGKCIVLAKFTAKNAYGVESEYVYKIWLTDKGGDWTEKDTWECTKLLIENASTREQNIFYPSASPTKTESNIFEEKEVVINGIKCKFYREQNDYAYIETSKKIRTEKMIDDVISKLDITAKNIYFLTPQGRKTSDEYALKTGNIILIYDNLK